MEKISRFAPAPICHVCARKASLETNLSNGGRYWACNACGFTWTGATGKLNPARRCVSMRSQALAKLQERFEMSPHEAHEFIDTLGLSFVMANV
jgi:hypothetical protein